MPGQPDAAQPRPAHDADAQAGDRLERCGTVAIEHHVKEDGRALILYRHREERSA